MNNLTSRQTDAEKRELLETSHAMLELAHAMQTQMGQTIDAIKKSCNERVEDYMSQVKLAAIGFGPGAQKGLSTAQGYVDVWWDKVDSSYVCGEARMKTGRCTNVHVFKCLPKDAKEVSGRAAIRSLINSHDWLSEGFEMNETTDDMGSEARDVHDMLVGFKSMGTACALLVEMVETETQWNRERWRACAWLEKMVNAAAKEGLLPKSFEGSSIKLFDGWPGQPTQVVSWSVRSYGFTSGARGDCALESFRGKRASEDDVVWELPSLDQGLAALWVSFCNHASVCQARGWTSMAQRYSTPEVRGELTSAVEARLLQEEISHDRQPAARSAFKGSL